MAHFNSVVQVAVCGLLGLVAACSGSSDGGSTSSGGASATGGASTGGAGTGGAATGGATTGGTAAGGSGTGGASTGGASSGGSETGGTGGSGPLPTDPCIAANTCPPGEWINVTPAGMADLDFGAGPVVPDPDTPSDLYVGGGGDGLWKSTDYGNTWSKISSSIDYVPMGYVMAVFPGSPTNILVAGWGRVQKSTDGGETFSDRPWDFPDSAYSFQIDPYDPTHVITGIHEKEGIAESTDGGDTWHAVNTNGIPGGATSTYLFFIETGSATTSDTWLAIGQGGGTAMTTNGGDSWSIPSGLAGLTHGHGNAQIYQDGDTLYVPGVYGPEGNGLYKSTDRGGSFTRIYDQMLSVAWGTDDNLYAMWGWACSKCDFDNFFHVAPLPGATSFTMPATPAGMRIGANWIANISDGNHNIFVGTMWADGIWRYVEP